MKYNIIDTLTKIGIVCTICKINVIISKNEINNHMTKQCNCDYTNGSQISSFLYNNDLIVFFNIIDNDYRYKFIYDVLEENCFVNIINNKLSYNNLIGQIDLGAFVPFENINKSINAVRVKLLL